MWEFVSCESQKSIFQDFFYLDIREDKLITVINNRNKQENDMFDWFAH
jgi:hypothetical protein